VRAIIKACLSVVAVNFIGYDLSLQITFLIAIVSADLFLHGSALLLN